MALVDKSAVPKEGPKEIVSTEKETASALKSPVAPSPVQAPSPAPRRALPFLSCDAEHACLYGEMVKAQFEGKGIGEKPLAQVVKENSLDMDYINKRLAASNLSAKEGETLKEMAARYKTTPSNS